MNVLKETNFFVSTPFQTSFFFLLFFPRAVNFILLNLPRLKYVFKNYIDVVFSPKAIEKQLLLAMVLETGSMSAVQLYRVIRSVSSQFSSRSRLISEMQDEWIMYAEQIGATQGNDTWRSEPGAIL